MKQSVLTLAVLAGMLTVPAGANEQYVPLGNLNCISSPGTGANAMVCKFRSFQDGSIEVYVALSEQSDPKKPALMNFNVVSSGKTAYAKGGLSDDFVAGPRRGELIGKKNPGLMLKTVKGPADTGVIRLQAAK